MSKFQEAITKQEAIVAAAQSKLAELIAAAAASLLTADVGPGYGASFKIGRAETRREVTGVVRGRGVVKDVDSVRVEVGEGFDLEVYTVAVSQLLSITKPGVDLSSVSPELDAPATAAQCGQSEADELLSQLNG